MLNACVEIATVCRDHAEGVERTTLGLPSPHNSGDPNRLFAPHLGLVDPSPRQREEAQTGKHPSARARWLLRQQAQRLTIGRVCLVDASGVEAVRTFAL